MKIELNEEGTLVLMTETPMEIFAMERWYDLWSRNKATFMIRPAPEFSPEKFPTSYIKEK